MTDPALDDALMDEALAEARIALAAGCFPVGAVLARGGDVLAWAHKTMGSAYLDHAEMNLFRAACAGTDPYARAEGLTVYTTLEPCAMCWGTLRHLAVARLVYAMEDPYGGCAGVPDAALPVRHRDRPLVVRAGVRREAARRLFAAFLDGTQDPYWLGGGAPEFVARVRAGAAIPVD